ncbi:hypothetical protein [Streptomyces sp. TP-A0874]|uniref:hypothetical protein n=1 Tax=Streptomyces sp. TP-A0874 TaxID=549819 RepID=UPI000853CBC7|nr:hypothetical protein [Streptomyces sp. TP-A0874]
MSSSRSPRQAARTLAAWPRRRWAFTALTASATALLVGVPTAVVPNPLFSRSVPVQWWNYPTLAVTAVLSGLVVASYLRLPGDPVAPPAPGRLGPIGGVLSFFAVGCPVCNKLVLLFLGTSGALSYWAPLQPLVAVAAVALLAEAALRRLATAEVCPAPASV